MKTTERIASMITRPAAPEVIPASSGEFPLISSDQAMKKVTDIIDANLAGQKMSVLNFPQIKAPSGGNIVFNIDSASGREPAREISGVIVAFRQARVYWKKAYGSGGGKKPPDCSSTDGFQGVGDPGGECSACRYAQFGTAVNPDGSQGAGQACKDIRQLLVLLPGQLLPNLFNLPPTSIKAFMQYVWNLTSEGSEFWSVVTRMVPEGTTSAGGVDYARIRFLKQRSLAPEQAARLAPYHDRMRTFLKPMTVDANAYEIPGTENEAGGTTEEEGDIPF